MSGGAANAGHCARSDESSEAAVHGRASLGLAPIVMEEIASAIRHLAAGGLSILLAEQNASFALRMADRACHRVRQSGTEWNRPRAFRRATGGRTISGTEAPVLSCNQGVRACDSGTKL